MIVWLKNDHNDLNLRSAAGARIAAAHNDQKPVVAAIKAAGGTDIVSLVSINAVAAHVSAAGEAVRGLSSVKEVMPDEQIPIGDPAPTGPAVSKATKITHDAAARAASRSPRRPTPGNPFPMASCGTIDNPLIEPEALQTINAPAMTNAGLLSRTGPRRGRRQRLGSAPPERQRWATRTSCARRRTAAAASSSARRRGGRRRLRPTASTTATPGRHRRAGHGPVPVLQGAAVLRHARHVLLQARR